MVKRKTDEPDLVEERDEFSRKVEELDFDPWGGEEDDGSQRRRDPFRRQIGERPPDEEAAD